MESLAAKTEWSEYYVCVAPHIFSDSGNLWLDIMLQANYASQSAVLPRRLLAFQPNGTLCIQSTPTTSTTAPFIWPSAQNHRLTVLTGGWKLTTQAHAQWFSRLKLRIHGYVHSRRHLSCSYLHSCIMRSQIMAGSKPDKVRLWTVRIDLIFWTLQRC